MKTYKLNARSFRTLTPFATTPHITPKTVNGKDKDGVAYGPRSLYTDSRGEISGVAWMTVENNHLIPVIPATALKSALRRAAATRLLRNKTNITSRLAEICTVGGIKHKGSTGTNPRVVAEMRNRFPLLAIFGAAVPHFIGGFNSSMAVPREVFKLGQQAIIRKDVLSEISPITDAIEAGDFARAMLERESIKETKKAVKAQEETKKAAKEAKKAANGAKKTSSEVEVEEVEDNLNSAQTLHGFHYIPQNIEFNHTISGDFTDVEIGMLIHTFKEFAKSNTKLGGQAGRGFGGAISFEYDVTAFDGDDWTKIGSFGGDTLSAGTVDQNGDMVEYFSATDGVQSLIDAYLAEEQRIIEDLDQIEHTYMPPEDFDKLKAKVTTALETAKKEITESVKKRGNAWSPSGDMIKFAIKGKSASNKLFEQVFPRDEVISKIDVIVGEVANGVHDEEIKIAYA